MQEDSGPDDSSTTLYNENFDPSKVDMKAPLTKIESNKFSIVFAAVVLGFMGVLVNYSMGGNTQVLYSILGITVFVIAYAALKHKFNFQTNFFTRK